MFENFPWELRGRNTKLDSQRSSVEQGRTDYRPVEHMRALCDLHLDVIHHVFLSNLRSLKN